jgi:DedD protein
MDEQKRYRATGSLFLIALAAICLPMLLDGEGMAPTGIAPLSIPEVVPNVADLNEVAPATELPARVAELEAQVNPDGFYVDSGARVGEPVLSVPTSETRIWAVQVASFKDPARARSLRNSLRQEGFEAFLSTVQRNDEVLNRVAVGPLLNESDAQQMRDELTLIVEQPARVMAFTY